MVAMVRAVVCLSLWMAVCQVRGFNIPTDMNRTIQSILQHYNVRQKLIFNGKAVFPKEMMPEQLEAKKTVMGGVLNTYEKLINQMLKGLPTPSPPMTGSNAPGKVTQQGSVGDVRSELDYILRKIKDLKRYHYQEQEKALEGLQRLKHIQVNDSVIQAKALWELSGLYQEASLLTNSTEQKQQQRRRRRQARKAKTSHVRG